MAPNQQPCPQTDLALIDILSNRGFRTEMEPELAWNTDVYLGVSKGGWKGAEGSPAQARWACLVWSHSDPRWTGGE